MGRITVDQSHQLVATLVTNTNWAEIDFEEARLQDLVVRDAQEAGRCFTAFLKNGARMTTVAFPTFKTIKLGTGLKTADQFRTALKEGGCRLSDWASDILGKPAFAASQEETEVDLVVVSVAELGFPNGATRADIYQKAQELGLELCPPEVGPQLRLQYKDQPKSEWFLIAMEPISASDGDLDVFNVEHDVSGLWLSCHHGLPDDFWDGNRWVFVRRK